MVAERRFSLAKVFACVECETWIIAGAEAVFWWQRIPRFQIVRRG
jgi:hypothetical protein